MKQTKLLLIIALMLSAVVLPSCSTSTKVTVRAKPGTALALPQYSVQRIGGSSDVTRYKISDNGYVGLSLAVDPQTGQKYPFAFDFKRRGTKTHNTMYAISFVFGMPTIWIWPLCEMEIGEQYCYQHKIKYLPEQNANTDLYVAPLDIEFYDEPLQFESSATAANESSHSSSPSQPVPGSGTNSGYTRWNVAAEPTPAPAAAAAQGGGTQSARRRPGRTSGTDAAGHVAGDYAAFGYLSAQGNQSESLSDITVRIERTDPTHVKVNVLEGDLDFFGSAAAYTVSVDESGKTTLTHTGIPTAVIIIGADGSLNYLHPRVDIDGTIYTLMLSGNKNN